MNESQAKKIRKEVYGDESLQIERQYKNTFHEVIVKTKGKDGKIKKRIIHQIQRTAQGKRQEYLDKKKECYNDRQEDKTPPIFPKRRTSKIPGWA